MRVAYLGSGTWGFCLASLLASKGHQVTMWTIDPHFCEYFKEHRGHPKLEKGCYSPNFDVSLDLKEVLEGAELVVESVTSKGVRPVCEQILKVGMPDCPFVVTSKGIEQKSSLLLYEVVRDVLGDQVKVGCLSGPSHAEEVVKGLPASVVASSDDKEVMHLIAKTFNQSNFRVYPNQDLAGVSFGGAMKNVIAIACGISDGLKYGDNAKAALMTRGLHEIYRLARSKGCKDQTLHGLSGMGDLCVTCLSTLSRNYRFGALIAKGKTLQEAEKEIGMVVEGVNTCISACELGRRFGIEMPIAEGLTAVLFEEIPLHKAIEALMDRRIQEEHI